MGFQTLVPNSTITSLWGNGEVRNQVISQFANVAARDSAISAPVNGQYCTTADTGWLWRYNGSAWAPAGAQLISAQTLGVAAGTVTFSSIPAVFGSLMLAGLGSVTGAGASGSVDCPMAINGDAAANYASLSIDASQSATTPASVYGTGQTSAAYALSLPSTTGFNAFRVAAWSMTLPGYANTTMRKAGTATSWMTDAGTSWNYKQRSWFWNSTTAITSLAFTSGAGNFSVGSYFALYGMP